MKATKKHLYLCLFLVIYNISFSQNETNNWYFGHYLYLNFNNNTSALTNGGNTNVREGSATISDKNGNLLFYTDGKKVWNRNHTMMPNGDSLSTKWCLPIMSTTQPAIIIPFPNNSNYYYIFTVDCVDDAPPHLLYYSIVDMSLNNGLGDISLKNQVLIDSVEEKLSAIHHCDGNSVWVSVHRYENNEFYSYLIDSNGVNAPVISTVGPLHTKNENGRGYMMFSPDGSKIALGYYLGKSFELYDFSNSTGIVSHPFLDSFEIVYGGSYGVSFSPNSQLLYVSYTDNNNPTAYSEVSQYNIALSDSIDIINSKVVLYRDDAVIDSAVYIYQGMSLAKDGKIYIHRISPTGAMAVITQPDSLGLSCNLVNDYFTPTPANYISPAGYVQLISMGISNFIQSYFCPLGPAYNHIILEKDTILPCGSTYILNTQGDWVSRLWSTGDTSQSITVSQSGCYSVTCVRENGCIKMDTVCIIIGPVNTEVTRNDATLTATAVNASYQWIDCNGNTPIVGATAQVFTPSVNGNYAVIVTENGCSDTSSCYLVSNVGIEEVSLRNGISVYPNPSNGVFRMSVPNMEGEKLEIVICDLTGRKVYERVLIGSDKEMEVRTGLASGLYVLYLQDVRTGARAVKRVAVE